MGQFSVKILQATGSVLNGNQQPLGRKLTRFCDGTAWQGRGITWHEKTKPLKIKKNKDGCTETATTTEKAFIYKGLKATGRLLRQVCRLPSGTDGLRRVKRSALPLEDVSVSLPFPGFHRWESRARICKNATAILLVMTPALACANGWTVRAKQLGRRIILRGKTRDCRPALSGIIVLFGPE
tara:strand:+ start:4067 stop:4612 length:546 start_codon:yes stop_codon:yes gene_type:complete